MGTITISARISVFFFFVSVCVFCWFVYGYVVRGGVCGRESVLEERRFMLTGKLKASNDKKRQCFEVVKKSSVNHVYERREREGMRR